MKDPIIIAFWEEVEKDPSRKLTEIPGYFKFKKREWYLKNKEKSKEQSKKWREAHPERVKENIARWKAENPERERIYRRKAQLKKKFQLSPEQFEEILKAQNNACAICERSQAEFSRRLAVDHCHKTGQIRGLLCSRCNVRLGHIEGVLDLRLSIRPFIYYLDKSRGSRDIEKKLDEFYKDFT